MEIAVIWPFVAFFIATILPKNKEKIISGFVYPAVGLHALYITGIILYWLINGSNSLNIKEVSVFSNHTITFYIDLYFDATTAVFLWIGALLVFMITTYSRIYLHNEPGFKRYFYTLLFAYSGYCTTVTAGNLETLFIGWEILGLTSFLMIAFYRTRYLPVKNAFKVFSIYRIGDVGIILAMWAIHHLWHENITFQKLLNADLVHHHLEGHSLLGLFIAVMLLVAACAKSAQLPFSSWLPRAMEGPTPSSAIFYGALSVHLGVFLLLRTMPFWEQQWLARIIIGLTGLSTALITTTIARVQSSLKSQIAYASVAQIGLMFIELALGLKELVLVHFAGNAFLRTYQLLASPSAVSYLIREQFYNFEPRAVMDGQRLKLYNTLYVLALKEWNLDFYLNRFIWKPMKNIGNTLRAVSPENVFYFSLPTYLLGLTAAYFSPYFPDFLREVMPELYALIGLILVFRAYAARKSALVPWILVIFNHLWVVLAIGLNARLSISEVVFYLSGVGVAGIAGFILLFQLKKKEPSLDLNGFQGHVYEYPRTAFAFLLAALALAGFPITTTFVGEDILFAHIEYDEVVLAFLVSSGFIVSGISLIRMYARAFLGPHEKTYHETAHRSS